MGAEDSRGSSLLDQSLHLLQFAWRWACLRQEGAPRADRSLLLADAMLADAVRRGWVTPPALAGGAVPPRKPVATFAALMQELRHGRGDR